jgi:hypothetical protein
MKISCRNDNPVLTLFSHEGWMTIVAVARAIPVFIEAAMKAALNQKPTRMALINCVDPFYPTLIVSQKRFDQSRKGSRPVPQAWSTLACLVLALAGLLRAARLSVPLGMATLLAGAQQMPDPLTLIVAEVRTTLSMPEPMPAMVPINGMPPRLDMRIAFEDRLSIADPSVEAGKRAGRLSHMVSKLRPRLVEEPVGDALCLTQAVYFEARGEPLEGQLAVAQVVLNRHARHGFPKSICGVVFEHRPGAPAWACQFSFACDKYPDVVWNRDAWENAKAIAFLANSRRLPDVTGGRATHYHTTWVTPPWALAIDERRTLGNHIFYREG